ncbi:hypothetical protein [Emticicia sp. BO119]|uniref:hypothetical protein n=1 Tax=Emticicia sp. BO119 TaxID=2757768 RepID=UPI0015F0A6DB|nr:hypothetical protein [Emticicia sp. BO119]MBA4853814.1 hypothetical protein [Emticicia sp. BO119]
MFKNIIIIVALLFVGLLSGCSKKYNPESPIEGLWVLDKYESVDDKIIISFHRASQFEENKAGYAFKPNGLLIARQNAGWCGTPPITYMETQGKWSLDRNKINLNGIYWGGTFMAVYEVHQVGASELQLKEVASKYNMDR